MNWLHFVSYFFGGLFLTNAVPHSVSGVVRDSPSRAPSQSPPDKGFLPRPSTYSGDFSTSSPASCSCCASDNSTCDRPATSSRLRWACC